MWIGQDLLFDAVAAITAGVDQPESRHTIGQPVNCRVGATFLLGEELRSVRDDQPHVADAGLVNAWVIDLIEDSVAQREPDPTLITEGRANAGLGAGSPARRNSGSTWCGTI
jgi:hypothetical protein